MRSWNFLIIAAFFCNCELSLAQPDSHDFQHSGETKSHAVIESAEYEATFSDGDFTFGTFHWNLLFRGNEGASIDISNVNLAFRNLKSKAVPAIWGTTRNDTQVVVVNPNTKTISGNWSKHGQSYPGTHIFDCQFPPAVKSELTISLPVGHRLQSSVGHVSSKLDANQPEWSLWTIDLGRHSAATFRIIEKEKREEFLSPKVSVETIHVARQDGIFVQCQFLIDGLNQDALSGLEFLVPNTLVVQSVSSGGISLPFKRDAKNSGTIIVTVPGVASRGRLSLRIQGFQPVRWVRQQRLPDLKLKSSLETKRTANIRIEAPLELHALKSKGFFQTGLTNEPRGEVWRFEAFEENPHLIVELGPPNDAMRSEVHSLHYLDTPLPWVASKISCTSKSGRLFKTTVSIPKEWKVVSAEALDSESEVSSWSVEQGLLNVIFKEPISADSRKSIEVLARTEAPEFGSTQPLPVPVVQNATTTSLRSDWILPESVEIDLSSTGQWNEVTSEFRLSQFWKNLQERQIRSTGSIRSFFSSNPNPAALPALRFFRASGIGEELVNAADSQASTTSQQESESESRGVQPTCRMAILTQAESLDHPVDPKLVHHATIEVFGQTTSEQLQLQLPESCLLSAVSVDGRAITVYRDGKHIQFPKDISSFSELSVIYITAAKQRWLTQTCNIPVPATALEATQFNWSLELPNERMLASVTLPDSKISPRNARSFFGPFSSELHSSLASESFDSDSAFHSSSNRETRIYHFQSPNSAGEIHFESWDQSRSQNVAWVSFLACLMIGTGGRFRRSSLVRKLSPYWLLSLIGFQLISVNEWSLIGGAMLIGSLISLFLPVEFLKVPAKQSSPKVEPNFATASLLLLAFFASSISAQEVSTEQLTSKNSDSAIPYLLRLVRYELLQENPGKFYRARLEVLTPNNASETLVELPFQGVVFQSGAECFIDGKPHTLIPSVDGQGVIVNIQNTPDPPQSSPAVEWQRHIVEFELSFRQESVPSIQSSIPRIIDASLKLPKRINADSVPRMGQILSTENESAVLSIGPVGNFVFPTNAIQSNLDSLDFYTLLNVSSARITGQLYIEVDDVKNYEELVLQLPPKIIVSQVTGQSVAQSLQTVGANGQRYLVIESKEDSPHETVVVSFSLPTLVNENGEFVVPKLDWAPGMNSQVFGLKTPPGISVEPVDDQQTFQYLSAEDWPQNDAFGRSRPLKILEINSGSVLRLRLSQTQPTKTYRAFETLKVSQATLDWSADVEIEVQKLPTFVHEFRLTGGIRINAVRSQQTGEETALRFHQSGDRVSVFLPGGQLGPLKIQLDGEGRFPAESFRAIPELLLDQANLSERSLTILDQTNWDLELKMPGGTTVTELAISPEDFNSPRPIGTFQANTKLRPTHLRLQPPPSATRVDVASRLHVGKNGPWTFVQLMRFSGQQTALKSVTFSIPKSYDNVRVSPSYFKRTTTDLEDSIEYTIQIPDRFVDSATLQVSSRFPIELRNLLEQDATTGNQSVAVPRIQISSARTASQFFFVNENRSLAFPSTGVLEVEPENLPVWIPLQWKDAATHSNLHGFQLLEDSLVLSPHRVDQGTLQAVIRYTETAVWPQQSGETRGITRLWMTGAESANCHLPFKETIQLEHAYLADGSEIPIFGRGSERAVRLETENSVAVISVHWSNNSKTTQQVRSPFSSTMSDQVPRLIGVIETGNLVASSETKESLAQIDTWIFRWKSLLELSKTLQSPLPIESALQRELRECQGRVLEAASENVLTLEQSEAIEHYREDWTNILGDLTVSAEAVTATPPSLKDSFSQLFDVHNEFQRVHWITSDQVNTAVFQIKEPANWLHWLLGFSKILIFLFTGILLLVFRSRIEQLVNGIERRPEIALLVLAIFWFLFLAPQVISFVCVCLAVFFYRRKLTGNVPVESASNE